jgi:simple sugar transport system ATP-binding protein
MHISIRHLRKTFGPVVASNDISVDFAAGQIHGILGENGAGKSTLMKILAGMYTADSGAIAIDGRPVILGAPIRALQAGIGMVGQDPLDIPVFTILENISAGIRLPGQTPVADAFAHWNSVLGFELDPRTHISQLTVGQRQQVEIIRLLITGSQLFILDEPTTGITAAQIDALFGALRTIANAGKTVLFVTHKLDEVAALCDTVTVLRGGILVGEQAQMPVPKEQILHAMFGERNAQITTQSGHHHPNGVVWSLSDVIMHDAQIRLGPITTTIAAGQIIGLAGLEGSGQTLFLQHLAGMLLPRSGSIVFAGSPLHAPRYDNVFLPADRLNEGIVPSMSLVEHVQLLHRHLLGAGQTARDKAIQLITDYNIKATPDMPLQLLSGGNQQRAMLALIPESARVILLEHPTRGLDAVSAEAIWQRLQERCARGATVVFFSADLEEVISHSDAVMVFYGGSVSRILDRDALSEQALARLIGGVGFAEVAHE